MAVFGRCQNTPKRQKRPTPLSEAEIGPLHSVFHYVYFYFIMIWITPNWRRTLLTLPPMLVNIASYVGKHCLLCWETLPLMLGNIASYVGEHYFLCWETLPPMLGNIASYVRKHCLLCWANLASKSRHFKAKVDRINRATDQQINTTRRITSGKPINRPTDQHNKEDYIGTDRRELIAACNIIRCPSFFCCYCVPQ